MSRYKAVDVRIYGDEKFRSLSKPEPNGQSLFLYLLTNPNTTMIPGVFRAGAAAMAEEMDWPLEGFRKAFQEVIEKGMVKADLKARVIWLPNAINYNKPQSLNVVIGWGNYWDEIPECPLKIEIYQTLKNVIESIGKSFREGFRKALRDPSPWANGNQEQEQEQEQYQKQEEDLVVLKNPELLAHGEPHTEVLDEKVSGQKKTIPKSPLPPCPQTEILKLYHEILPSLRQMREWHETRQKYLQRRWRDDPARQNLHWWRKFFVFISQSKFLTGQISGRDGKPPFCADLEWIVKPTNFAKIIEGKYHTRKML